MKRLKIVEQLIIVLFVAVLFPLSIAAVIITNVNQHAVRSELKYSASITADSVYQRLSKTLEEKVKSLSYIADSLKYIDSQSKKELYLQQILDKSDEIAQIDIINKDNDKEFFYELLNKNALAIYYKLPSGQYLREIISVDVLESDIFKILVDNKTPIVIADQYNNVLMSYNYKPDDIKKIVQYLPKKADNNEVMLFGKYKNQPNILLKMDNPAWSIIVLTPQVATKKSIVNSRSKILIALSVAALTVMLVCLAYVYSLYTNIRQLFKAIVAIGKGNYSRRIRLIKDFFTPYEVIFLTNEFNNMAEKIDNNYSEIQLKNDELEKINKYKSNLIDTVSHELRTPLTSIKGYTSRLLRTDVEIDEETKHKSLKVIKQQSERLSRMIEDLLVIPDIESSLLRVFPEEINLKDSIEDCLLFVQHKQSRNFILNIEENLPSVYADKYRTEQIILNLLDNAIKYAYEDADITVKVEKSGNFAKVSVQNQCEQINDEILHTLFEKFTRIDDNLTRTTRGTGLGLYIVKGLVETMNGKIWLSSENGFEITFTLPFSN